MIKYTSVREPRWANNEKNLIDCIVKFEHLKVEVPFTASPRDVEVHGQEIYSRCVRGDFGAVENYQPDPTRIVPTTVNVAGDVPILVHSWPEIEKFLLQANIENVQGTPRGIVLVWASMIEELLGRLLEAFLVNHSSSRDLIWDDAHSSLGTFSGRSKCCFVLGLISRDELMICDRIRSIRNATANQWNMDLENPKFTKYFSPAIRAIYDADHAQLYNWIADDLVFMIKHFYAGSCAMLAIKFAERRIEILKERRTERDVGLL